MPSISIITNALLIVFLANSQMTQANDAQKLAAFVAAQQTKVPIPKENNTLQTPKSSAVSTSPAPVIDLLLLYTTETNTDDFMKQRIQYLMTLTNQAYQDSGINMSVRLVHAEPIKYSETISNPNALREMKDEVGAFAGLKTKRVQYGADLVFLLRPLHAKTHVNCGTTYVQFARGTEADKEKGYGTISDGIDKDGSKALCQISTFTHEIGHSLGLIHDREYSTFQGAYDYAYAWGIKDNFGTIMSYNLPVVMLFSSPNLNKQCAGSPCGYPESDKKRSSDQVKTVNLTAPKIAAFMPAAF